MLNEKNIEYRFVETVIDFSKRYDLFRANRKYLVALSGGADSVALLLVMKKMGIDTDAVTCNFHYEVKNLTETRSSVWIYAKALT